MNNKVERLIEQAYDRLKELDAVSALQLLQEALSIDYEHSEVKYGLKCINWWLDRIKKLEELREPFEKGGYIISSWKLFHVFLDQIKASFTAADNSPPEAGVFLYGTMPFDSCQYAVKHYAFTLALKFLEEALTTSGNNSDPEILIQIGRCYKGAGNYEEAVKFLEQLRKEDSGAMADLADVNALLGDLRAAKVLFREAFYIDPQAVDLWSMESEMIVRLREKVAELGHSGRELAEWLPVYGALWGIFSVRRELKPIELGKLKQSILTLESELNSKPDSYVKPRLINRYFWLIDHCGMSRGNNVRDNSDVVEETMRKIKFIDPVIFEQYHN